ncbi:aminopeptidase P family protein [Pedobacter sp. PWIIR3]
MFNKEEYIKRRQQLADQFKSGIVLFLGNGESPMNYLDNTYHFRQDSTFLYYFGISSPNLAAVLDIAEGKTILFGDEMSMDDIVWMGRQKTLNEKALEVGVELLAPSSKLSVVLANAAQKGIEIHFLPPYRAENKIKLSQLLSLNIQSVSSSASLSFIKAVIAQRSIKSAVEIEEIHKAVSTSVDMQLLAMQMARPGMSEREIAAALQAVASTAGGNIAYPIILTINGHILHNHYHGNLLQEGDLVLNDSGAESALGYAGDLTRTFPAGKTFTSVQKELYSIVLNSYRSAVNLLKPGVRYLDVHLEACLQLAEGLKTLGLMKGNMKDAVQQGAHALFFQCGTGHMMGLDVHDMEDLGEQYVGYSDELLKNTSQFGLKSLRLGKALEEGYVLTVEPGLYFIPELIEQWESEKFLSEFINYEQVNKFKSFGGIRVEDDFLITANGSQILGKPLALNIEEIEQIRYNAF